MVLQASDGNEEGVGDNPRFCDETRVIRSARA